ATSLSNLGVVATAQGDFASARALFEESLTILRQLEDPWGIAIALGNLGSAANEAGDYRAARSRHEESLAIKRKLGNRVGIAKTLDSLASVSHVEGDYPTAKARYERLVAAARAALGDDAAFSNAWQEGRALMLEQAIEIALLETVPRP